MNATRPCFIVDTRLTKDHKYEPYSTNLSEIVQLFCGDNEQESISLITVRTRDVLANGSPTERKAAFLDLIWASQRQAVPENFRNELVQKVREFSQDKLFHNLDLSNINFTAVNLNYLDLSYSDLCFSDIRTQNLATIGLTGAKLSYAVLPSANITNINNSPSGL